MKWICRLKLMNLAYVSILTRDCFWLLFESYLPPILMVFLDKVFVQLPEQIRFFVIYCKRCLHPLSQRRMRSEFEVFTGAKHR